MSAAYYAVFHSILTAVADELIGKTKRNTPEYGLAYRSLNHGRLRELCNDLKKPTLPAKIAPYAPPTGFGPGIEAVARAVIELQERRHTADYDPMQKFKTADALLAIRTARSAVERMGRAGETERRRFLVLLAFQPRQSSAATG